MNSPEVTRAPQWLVDRMEALKKLPPPTLEEVEAQFAACAKWQDEYGFSCVEKIKKSDYIR
jgi:hypothetical protein